VALREDDCRVRKGDAPENLAILRHIAVNAVKQEKTKKLGVKNKRLAAGWDETYLAKILCGGNCSPPVPRGLSAFPILECDQIEESA
jgi:hypothetical protein